MQYEAKQKNNNNSPKTTGSKSFNSDEPKKEVVKLSSHDWSVLVTYNGVSVHVVAEGIKTVIVTIPVVFRDARSVV